MFRSSQIPRASRRFASVVTELSNDALPAGTGRGPFVELPQFKPLGNPSHLLNVTLPRHSTLNIRNGAIVALNGDLSHITTTPVLWYQQLFVTEPASLLVSGRTDRGDIYTILDASKHQWTVLRGDNVIAWLGFDLKLERVATFDKFTSLQTSGKGTIVVNGKNQLFDVEVAPGESILVNPNVVVATTAPLQPKVLHGRTRASEYVPPGVWTTVRVLRRPLDYLPESVAITVRLALSNTSRLLHERWTSVTEPLRHNRELQKALASVKQAWLTLLLHAKALLFRKPIFVEVTGPAKLLLANDSQVPNRRIFSKREINKL